MITLAWYTTLTYDGYNAKPNKMAWWAVFRDATTVDAYLPLSIERKIERSEFTEYAHNVCEQEVSSSWCLHYHWKGRIICLCMNCIVIHPMAISADIQASQRAPWEKHLDPLLMSGWSYTAGRLFTFRVLSNNAICFSAPPFTHALSYVLLFSFSRVCSFHVDDLFVRHMSVNAGWDVMWRLLYYPSWRKERYRVLPQDIEWCRESLFLECHVYKKKDMEMMAHHFTNGDKMGRWWKIRAIYFLFMLDGWRSMSKMETKYHLVKTRKSSPVIPHFFTLTHVDANGATFYS